MAKMNINDAFASVLEAIASGASISQPALDALQDAAIGGGDQKALKLLRQLRDNNLVHIGADGMRMASGPKPVESSIEQLAKPLGPATKKELDPSWKAEAAAAEARLKAQQEAQRDADLKIVQELEAQKAAQREAEHARIARETAEQESANALRLEAERSKLEQQDRTQLAGQMALTAQPAKETAPQVPVAKPVSPEAEAIKEQRKQAAQEAVRAAQSSELEGIEKRTITPTSTPEERLKVLQGRAFKKEWGKASEAGKSTILKNTFGDKALQLNSVTRQKLGELALAFSGFKSSGLQSVPNMDDIEAQIKGIQDRIKGSADIKGIEASINNLHGRVLTVGGKIRGPLLKFRGPRAGEVGSERPKPASPVEERLPGFDKAKKIKGQLPFDAEDVPGAAPAAAPAAEAAAPAEGFDTENVPAAAGVAAEVAAEAAVGATAEKPAKEESAYRKAVNADPEKYGTNDSQTKEQKKARRKLADDLGLNAPEAKAERAAKRAKFAEENPAKAETNRRWGEAVRANPTKYGKSRGKRTKEQKKAADALYKQMEAEVEKEFAARGGAPAPAAPAAPAKAPAAPAKAAAPAPAKAPAPAVPAAPAAPAPTPAPAPAPTPGPVAPPTPPAPAAPAAAGKTGKKGFTNKQIRDRAKKIYGSRGLASVGRGALGFLGPLLGMYTLYELASMAKGGTVDAADERRLKAIQALGAVGGGVEQDVAQRAQIRQMQQMVDMAALQRAQSNDQMRRRYIEDDALNSLLVSQQASLGALAQPSRPSIAEMMARM